MKVGDVAKIDYVGQRDTAKKLLQKQAWTERELADEMGMSVGSVRRILKELTDSGANFVKTGDKLSLHNVVEPGGHLVLHPDSDGWLTLGFK